MTTLLVPIIYGMLQLFSFIILGIFIGKRKFWNNETFQGVNKFLITFALPAFLFSRIIKTDIVFLKQSLIFPAAAIISISVSIAAGYLLARIRKLPHNEAKAIGAMSGFGNSGYLPLTLLEILPISVPLILEKFGTREPALYIGAFVLVFSPFFWSFGNYLVTGSKKKLKFSDIITPPFIGVILAFIVLLTEIQPALEKTTWPFFYIVKALETLGNVTFPLVLINLGAMIAGLHINRQKIKTHLLTSLIPLGIRYFLLPGIFFLLYFTVLKPMTVSPVICWVLFLESFTPPATNFSVMAARSGENVELVSFTMLITHTAFIILFPIALLLFLSSL